MYYSVILLGVVVISSHLEFSEARLKKHLHRRIVNGDIASKADWPSIAFLTFRQRNAPFKICSGTLISPIYVLTVAHCTQGVKNDHLSVANPADIRVTLGIIERDKLVSGGVYTVKRIIQHPKVKEINKKFNEQNFAFPGSTNYDIALLELRTPLVLNPGSKIADYKCDNCRGPAILEEDAPADGQSLVTDEDKNYQDCQIAGWGAKKGFSSEEEFAAGEYEPAKKLQQGDVKMLTAEACKEMLKKSKSQDVGYYSSKVLCGTYKTKNISGCLGDSGSPLVCKKGGKKYLAGLVTVGDPGCNPDGGAMIFTKVETYRSWIDGIIKPPVQAQEEQDLPITRTEASGLDESDESSTDDENQ